MSGESAGERWSPVQRVETVLISILSLLDDAEVSSPANVDAGVMLRNEPRKYKDRVKQDVETSKNDIPDGFIMPTHESTKPVMEKEDEEFWVDSEVDDDAFGGSESDAEMTIDDDEDEDEDDDEDEARQDLEQVADGDDSEKSDTEHS